MLRLVLPSMLVAVALLEGVLASALRHAGGLPGPLRRALLAPLRRIHLAAELPLVQLDPACARWDADLAYTLRPPGCTIRDREFTVRYDANRAGLRDDERSLERPEVIVVGDSFAMGWGVAEAEAFPAVLERTAGLRVLNAGVASFGTAREMTLLRRLDRSALRALVVQYCSNDDPENRQWVSGGGRLPIVPERTWLALVASHQRALRYWPGKYLWTLVRTTLGWSGSGIGTAHAGDVEDPAVASAADDFMAVLGAHRDLAGDVPVLVVPFCRGARAVAAALRMRAATSMPRLAVVEPRLGVADRFPLDGHPNAAGHAAVAARLAEALRRAGVVPVAEAPARTT